MEINRAQELLESERARLTQELEQLGRPNPGIPGDWELAANDLEAEPDPLDQAKTVSAREDNAAILADLEARLGSVNEALKRAAGGTYGRCEVCGAPIEAERLAADPAAATCVAHR